MRLETGVTPDNDERFGRVAYVAANKSDCRNTVASAMREFGLKSRVSKKFKPTTTVVDPTKRHYGLSASRAP